MRFIPGACLAVVLAVFTACTVEVDYGATRFRGPDGTCPGGQDPVPSEQCQFNPCAGPLCCLPGACTPDPPFCIAPALLTCNGISCSIDSCFGNLTGDRLDCQFA